MQESEIRELRTKYKIKPVYRLVDTCAGEFNSKTPYLYSTYDWCFENEKLEKIFSFSKDKISTKHLSALLSIIYKKPKKFFYSQAIKYFK